MTLCSKKERYYNIYGTVIMCAIYIYIYMYKYDYIKYTFEVHLFTSHVPCQVTGYYHTRVH